jgi:predicted dehydrogenase
VQTNTTDRERTKDHPFGVAILGCGFVADFYMATLPHHPEIRVVGAFDTDAARLDAFSRHHPLRRFASVDEMLHDASVDIVLNLTNPKYHYATTRQCLDAGKHVYSEKPLAMTSVEAAELLRLADERGLLLVTAPCSLLSTTAQTMWKALRDGTIGRVRLVYANFDDGMVHRLRPDRWRSASGAPWPARDEYETGCTYEHAAYVLSWLAFFFGPARRVQAFASCQLPDKGVDTDAMAPDFSVGCIEYDGGIVARVTCSLLAPADKSIVIIGDEGVLYTKYVRDDFSPVYVRKTPPSRIAASIGSHLRRWQSRIESWLRFPYSANWSFHRRHRTGPRSSLRLSAVGKPVDFLLGVSEMIQSLREGRTCRLSPQLGLHMIELVETLQYPERFEARRTITSSFDPIPPRW